jgi:uncharacterized Tic20 family protein
LYLILEDLALNSLSSGSIDDVIKEKMNDRLKMMIMMIVTMILIIIMMAITMMVILTLIGTLMSNCNHASVTTASRSNLGLLN